MALLITLIAFAVGAYLGFKASGRPTLPAIFFWIAGGLMCFAVAFSYGGVLGAVFIIIGGCDFLFARECFLKREKLRA